MTGHDLTRRVADRLQKGAPGVQWGYFAWLAATVWLTAGILPLGKRNRSRPSASVLRGQKGTYSLTCRALTVELQVLDARMWRPNEGKRSESEESGGLQSILEGHPSKYSKEKLPGIQTTTRAVARPA